MCIYAYICFSGVLFGVDQIVAKGTKKIVKSFLEKTFFFSKKDIKLKKSIEVFLF